MRRVASVAVCALALLAGSGVEARRHGAGMHAGAVSSVPAPAVSVAEATAAVVAPPAPETHLFAAAAVPQGAQINVEGPNGWVLYKQCGESWSNDELGTAAGVTICDAGCAMSSVSMILRTKGANVNPGTLNSWLRNNGGYVSGDLLVWSAPNAFGVAKMTNYYHGSASMSQEALQAAISAGHGVVVNVRNGGHWVLVTGHAGGSTYTVNDPGFSVNSYTYGEMSNFVVYA